MTKHFSIAVPFLGFAICLLFVSKLGYAQSSTIVECELATTAEKEGKLDESLIRLKNCLSSNPNYAPGLLLQANIFEKKQQYNAAINIYNTLIANKTDYALFSESWGNALWQQKQFDTIIQFSDYKKLPVKQKDDWLLLRSRACIAINNLVCAQSSLERIVTNEDNKLDLLLGLAQIKIHQKAFSQAEDLLDKAQLISPDNQAVNYIYGTLALEKKQASNAIPYFLKILEKDPTNTLVLRRLTDAYLMDELQLDATKTIENILALQPGDPFALSTREIILSQLNDRHKPDQAFVSMRNSVATLPDDVVKDNSQLLYLRGLLAFKAEQYESASKDFTALYQKNKSDLQSIIFLAKSLLSLGKSTEAIRLLENNQESLFDTPDILLLLVEQYIARNQTFKALPLLEKLHNQYPDSPKVSLLEVKYWVARGQIEKALALLDTLIAQYPYSPDINRIATIYGLQTQNYELAEKSLTALQKIQNNSITRELSAVLALKRGKLTQAKTLFLELQALNPSSLTVNYSLALIDLAEKNNAAAVIKLKKNLEVQSNHSASLYLLGLIKLDQKQVHDGRLLLEKAAVASGNTPYILKALITLENDQGNYKASLDYANQLVNLSPFNIDFLLLRADIFLKQNNVAKVDTEIQRILEMSGLVAIHYVRLSNLYLQINKPSKAGKVLVNAANTLGDNTLFVRAIEIFLNANETEQAKNVLTQLNSKEKQDPRLKFLSARLFEQENKIDEAKKQYLELANVDPYSNILMGKLYQYSSDSQIKSAMLHALERRISENSNDYFAQNLLAQVYFYDVDLVNAREQYKKLLLFKDEGNRAGIFNRLSIISDRLNQPESTLSYAKQAYELNSNNPSIMAQYGWSLTRFDDPNTGLKILREASSLDYNNDLIHYYTAEALYKLGLYKESYAEIETLSHTDSSQIQALTLKLKEKL